MGDRGGPLLSDAAAAIEAVRSGHLVLVGEDRYGIPAMAGATSEDQMLASGAA